MGWENMGWNPNGECTMSSTIVSWRRQKFGKKKSLASSWEGPLMFVRYLDGHGFLEQDEGKRVCVVKGKDDKLWDRPWHDL